MADAESKDDGESKPKSMFMVNVLVSAILGFICGGLGFFVFTFLSSMNDAEASDATEVDKTPAFVEFGEVIVNLEDARMSRYLSIGVTLQVYAEDEETVTADVELQNAVLRNWLIGYLSDLNLEDIRGGGSQNRIRRDILNSFNEIIAPDGTDVVQEVLFDKFTVQ